jgi:glycosyltransferase involved in cell wall biosynthesis
MMRCGHIAAASVTLERFVVPLVPRMRELGLDSFLITAGDARPAPESADASVIYAGVGRGLGIWRGWIGFGKAFDEILALAPDVLFVHTPATAISSRRLLLRLKYCGVKLVYVARGSLDESSSRAVRSAWTFADPMKWCLWDAFVVANEFLGLRAAHLHPQTHVIRAALGAAWPNVPAHMPTSFDLLPWQERGYIRLGWVGRYDRDKRPEDFGALVDTLNARFAVPAKGVMIGAAIAGDRRSSHRAGAAVEEIGWHDHPWEVLGECDLNISTSVREGYGLTPIEAAAVGTPTIAYANHGTELSVPEVLGELVRVGGLQAMADRVADYAQHSAELVAERRRTVAQAAWSRLATADPAAEFVQAALTAVSP